MTDYFTPIKFMLLNKYNLFYFGTLIERIGLDQPNVCKSGTFSQIKIVSPLKSHSEKSSAQYGSNILKFASYINIAP